MVKGLDFFFIIKGVEGLGFGFLMVYDMVKLMGGDVWLFNIGEGVVVLICLLLWWVCGVEVSGFVFLVEDNLDLCGVIREMLIE